MTLYKNTMKMVAEVEKKPPGTYSEETCRLASLARCVDDYHKAKLALMPKKLCRGEDENGWMFDYEQIDAVKKLARNYEDVSLEQVEAVMLAMIDAKFAHAKRRRRS
jgi:hypothetical protein